MTTVELCGTTRGSIGPTNAQSKGLPFSAPARPRRPRVSVRSSLAPGASLSRWPAAAIFSQEKLNLLPRNLDPLVPERFRPHQKSLVTVVIQRRVVLHQPQVVDNDLWTLSANALNE